MELVFNENLLKQVIRIKKIDFVNFRNIGKGSISFPNSEFDDVAEGAPSILGLYGQNGSGKTSVIMALSVLKKMLSGQIISKNYSSCIRHGCDRCSLSFTLGLYSCGNTDNEEAMATTQRIEIVYSFDLTSAPNPELSANVKKIPTDRLFVENEIVQIRISLGNGKIIAPKQVLIDTSVKNSNAKGMAFGNATKYSQMVGDDPEVKKKLLLLKKKKYINGKSFVFSPEFLNIVIDSALDENSKPLMDAFARATEFFAAFSGDDDFSLQSTAPALEIMKDKSNPSNSALLARIAQFVADDFSADSDAEEDDLLLSGLNMMMSIIGAEDKVLSDINPNHKKWASVREFSHKDIDVWGDEYDELIDSALNEMFTRYSILSSYMVRLNYGGILASVEFYGCSCLHIVDTSITGQTNMNTMLPLLLWGYQRNGEKIQVNSECINLNMDEKTGVLEEKFDIVEQSIQSINMVLSELVPNMRLGFEDLGIEADADDIKKHYFEIQSVRNDTLIPLKYESDGVRRIVSLTSLFIAVYNEPSFTMAIDEIDSGIFEYLLGELFQVLAENAQGQFIFTSHNLRPLEVLPAKYLCFTTTNPDKRFVKLRNRGNCNLRDTYFRTIILGSDTDMVYQPTDRYRIQRAFYNAGHGGDSR